MSTLTVNNTALTIKEYKGQRVVTFKDIDTVHGRVEGTARDRFTSNKKHFSLGIDYYIVSPENSMYEKHTLGKIPPKGLTLLTESGYLLLVKSFTDDLAWQVQRQLVNAYFRCRKEPAQKPKLETPYRYTEKHYNGQIVATIRDLYEIWKPLSVYAIRYNIKKHLDPGTDYFDLKGKALAEFKEDCNNDPTVKLANELFVVTYSGIKRLAKLLTGGDFEPIKKFELKAPPTPQRVKWAMRTVTDIPENPKAQELIQSSRDKLTAMSELLTLINRYNCEEDFKAYTKLLSELCSILMLHTSELRQNAPRMIQKYI